MSEVRKMKEKREIVSLRKACEKHFLMEDGTIIAEMYSEPVHYLKNGIYEEIDNTLEEKEGYFCNRKNEFQAKFKTETHENELFTMERDGHRLSMYFKSEKDICPQLKHQELSYFDLLDDIDVKYQVLPTKVKESIILKEPKTTPDTIEFIIDTDLELYIPNDGTIQAKFGEQTIFIIEEPYMIDFFGKENHNLYYSLEKHDHHYDISLHLDKEWLDLATFPVAIDPTISSTAQNKMVYDTYIFPGDDPVNANNDEFLKIGIENVNGNYRVNRALIKFELPTIGTGSQIVKAEAIVTGYEDIQFPTRVSDTITVHRVTADWNEATAKWSNMNANYDPRVEDYATIKRSLRILYEITTVEFTHFDITNLVRQWYGGVPNYGFMLKTYREPYISEDAVGWCYSNNNHIEGYNPKPYLMIQYRNQNGLEDYMDTLDQGFEDGTAHVNLYNGNLTTAFLVGSTREGKLPVNLILYYNTNDIVLNYNYGYGVGCKLNLHQEIKEVTIENYTLLQYLDEDGTLHYFYKGSDIGKDENTYYDEDGLSLTIRKENENLILTDNTGNTLKFIKNNQTWYLREIKNTEDYTVQIEYDNVNRISKIIDTDGQEIYVVIDGQKVTISSIEDTVILDYDQQLLLQKMTTKNGITLFTHNGNKVIDTITDVDGTKIQYQYYDMVPYRVKKISEYGVNNGLGNYLDIVYGYNVTTITDEKGQYHSYTFNSYGNTVNLSNLKNGEDVYDAYGTQYRYWEQNFENGLTGKANKLQAENPTIRAIKNYIKNPSFEEAMSPTANDETLTETVTEEYAVTGTHALKLVSQNGEGTKTFEFDIPKGKQYTYSLYLKHIKPIRLTLHYDNTSVDKICYGNDEFYREELTLYYPLEATTRLKATITFTEPDTIYIDDMQLEEGEIANLYNIIYNADFSDGMNGWTITARKSNDENMTPMPTNHQIINLSTGQTALKMTGELDKTETLTKDILIAGKAGDAFDLYFWYKNNGIERQSGPVTRHALVTFDYVDSPGTDSFPQIPFTVNNTQWQLFHDSFVAEYDYTAIHIIIFNVDSVNLMYLTDFSLFKALLKSSFEYDDYGNMTSARTPNARLQTFDYNKDNQLIQLTDVKGNHLSYEYDNKVKDRLLRGMSASGITNETEYDQNGNAVITRVYNRKQTEEVEEKKYYIRRKGTREYLNYVFPEGTLRFKENSCSYDSWKFEKNEEGYKILFAVKPEYKLFQFDDTATISRFDETIFEIIRNKNGSYQIKVKDKPLYMTATDKRIEFIERNVDDAQQEFYLEEIDAQLFIENSATYTEDGKFLSSITNTLGRITSYQTNSETGLIESITDSSGYTTNYTYDQKERMTKVERAGKTVEYQYDTQNLLSEIGFGNKKYKFIYDEFGNTKQVKIGDVTLITHNYEPNNGNLSSSIYGNQHMISYTYDAFDRIKSVTKMNEIYEYQYDNTGNIAKVDSPHERHRYHYDFANRLIEYQNNIDQFHIKYEYGEDSTITAKHYRILDNNILKQYHISYEYNKDNQVTDVTLDDQHISYIYDSLGRMREKQLSDGYVTEYSYITNGDKTSYSLDRMKINGNEYYYTYDLFNNIENIYFNGTLVNHYEYDPHSELIKDEDYRRGVTTTYEYDSVGNLLSKKIYDHSTETLLHQDVYMYENEDWEDQLTKYNDQEIHYDVIGNPISIGNDELVWKNGRQLYQYKDHAKNCTYTYRYDKDGIRTQKSSTEGTDIQYYLEGKNIVLEKRGNNMLYYVRDNNDELIGFEYNQEKYFYEKNAQDDIIALLDHSYSKVAIYQYDAWGKILSVTDIQGNEITDSSHIAHINPFRYRSYYYDEETKLYYLNSRYYNPEWGRFLNADNIFNQDVRLLGNNLYIYVFNNPINRTDQFGNFSFGKIIDLWCNGAKIIADGIKKAVKKVKKKVKNTVNDIKKAFTFEVGLGFGVGAGAGVGQYKLSAKASKTFGYGISQQKGYQYTNTSVTIGGKIKQEGHGLILEAKHINDDNWRHNNPMVMPHEVWNCKNTERNAILSLTREDLAVESTIPSDTIFVGISIEAFVIVGGNLKIGFNIEK